MINNNNDIYSDIDDVLDKLLSYLKENKQIYDNYNEEKEFKNEFRKMIIDS